MMTTDTTDTPPQPAAVGAQVQRSVRPSQACAYRLRDEEASAHYGEDVYVYYSDNEFKGPAKAAITKTLEPLYDQTALDAAVAAMQEKCAKVAKEFLTKGRSPLGRSVAAAIRGA